jgi:farnesol dehydrogenase
MKIFLTGAGGFLGGRLARSLKEKGHSIRLLIHKTIPEFATSDDYETVQGDITDYNSLAKAIKSCDAIIHTAALVKNWVPDSGLFYKVNVDGLRNVLRAGEEESIKKIVYTSSFIALGKNDNGINSAGDSLPDYKPYNEYEATKREALRVARKRVEEGLPLTITIPGVIYGPGAITSGNLVVNIILDRYNGRDFFLPRMGDKIWNFSYIDDVVEGHIKLLEGDFKSGEFTLGGDNRPLDEFWDIVCPLIDARRPRMIIPFWLAKTRALLYDELIDGRIKKKEPHITRGVIDIYKQSWAISTDDIEKLLDKEPVNLENGIKRTVNWLIEKGLIQ